VCLCGGAWEEAEGNGGGFLGPFFGVLSFICILVALDSFALRFVFFGGSCVYLECESLVLCTMVVNISDRAVTVLSLSLKVASTNAAMRFVIVLLFTPVEYVLSVLFMHSALPCNISAIRDCSRYRGLRFVRFVLEKEILWWALIIFKFSIAYYSIHKPEPRASLKLLSIIVLCFVQSSNR